MKSLLPPSSWKKNKQGRNTKHKYGERRKGNESVIWPAGDLIFTE
jgi:hypothetical protein